MANTPSVDEKRVSFEREALVHLDVLYRVALRLTGNPSDADDLVQETMLKAYRAWDQYEKGTNAKHSCTWTCCTVSPYGSRATRPMPTIWSRRRC